VTHERGGRICVIGAGPCGLTTLKNLLAAGFDDVVCYDESGAIGGNWVFSEDPSRTSVYEVTHIISSKWLSGFEDFPMPDDYPDYPSHRQILAYFEDYAAHFGLLPHVHLRTQVRHASLRSDGRWAIRLSVEGRVEEGLGVEDHVGIRGLGGRSAGRGGRTRTRGLVLHRMLEQSQTVISD